MKFFAPIAAVVLLLVSLPAHATMPPNALMNDVNGSGPVVNPFDIGGGGGSGGGTPIGGICNNSPENATVLLALLAGAGLLTGRQISRARNERKPVLASF